MSARTDPSSSPDRPAGATYACWDGPGRGFSRHTTSLPVDPPPGRAVVAVDLATVCGSDVHTVRGDRPAPSPGILGHEQVGHVVAVAADDPPGYRDGTPLRVGDRVVWSVTVSCGRCDRCRRGLEPKCRQLRKYGHEPLDAEGPDGGPWVLSGGFASHVELLTGTTVVRVPADVPDTVAAPASCATATVAAALTAAGAPGLVPGELAGRAVLITGAGMLGVTAAAMAAAAGAHVVVSDPDPRRRALARRFGAHEVREPGVGADRVDVAIELSGASQAVEQCLASLDTGGRAVLAGAVSTTTAVPVDPERVVRNLLTISGVHNYRPADLERAVAFLAGHHVVHPFAELVTDDHALDTVDVALAHAESGASLRPALRPTRSGRRDRVA